MQIALTFPPLITAEQTTVLLALLADYRPRRLHANPQAHAWCTQYKYTAVGYVDGIKAVDAAEQVFGVLGSHRALTAAAAYARGCDKPLLLLYPNGAFVREGNWPK